MTDQPLIIHRIELTADALEIVLKALENEREWQFGCKHGYTQLNQWERKDNDDIDKDCEVIRLVYENIKDQTR